MIDISNSGFAPIAKSFKKRELKWEERAGLGIKKLAHSLSRRFFDRHFCAHAIIFTAADKRSFSQLLCVP
ncbi:MAG: hypothetical protein FWG10_08780 [Eubacteriaceae bacterium]|nr:hypothetical protein [Eubacteriaceae bacterium]